MSADQLAKARADRAQRTRDRFQLSFWRPSRYWRGCDRQPDPLRSTTPQ